MSAGVLARLHELLRDGGGMIAELLAGEPHSGNGASGGPGARAAAGPRASGHREDYELLVEAVYEGYLLHYGTPRLLRSIEDDLGLLVGDRLYAIGLERLVALDDTAAIAELADTITLAALAQSGGESELAEAVWMAGASAVGWGTSDAHRLAKQLVVEGRPGALEAMRTSAEALPASP